jgi:hypothetical protein
MKSIVELEVAVPKQELAALFADPGNMTKWMDDLERYEHVGGDAGMRGSTYRMVPKAGTSQMEFTATVTARNLPDAMGLKLESPNVDVSIICTFGALSPHRTKLVSEEVFMFRGLFNKLFGLLAMRDIRKHHRRHMEAFKRFAESL